MKKKFKLLHKVNLCLFDDGAGAGAAAGDNAGAAKTGENHNSSIPGKKNKAVTQVVKYGIPEETPEDTTTAGKNQLATDDKQTTTNVNETPEARKARFEQMIQGEYKDLFTERTQGIINERFKANKGMEAQLSKFSKMQEALSVKYGVEDGDPDKILAAMEKDDSYFEEAAMNEGMTVEQYKRLRTAEVEAAHGRKIQADMQERQAQNQRYNAWLQQAEALKASEYPDLDLNKECDNPDFVRLCNATNSVKYAYDLIHMEEIKKNIALQAAQQSQLTTINNIQARNQRPIENGLSSQVGTVYKTDVSKLSREDRKAAILQARRGEQVRFK
jgi:hypothetical protein